jgi:predicted aldo/keto reductase-like oxidoreductase
MSDRDDSTVDRRSFLQAGAAVGASALALGHAGARAAEDAKLPTRKLGKTGVEVTILNQGTWRAPDSLQRLLRTGFAGGIRYYDTAKSYGSEPGLAQWFKAMPAVRKEIFLVTKDSPVRPRDMIRMLDQRLKNLQTDHVDLFFAHAMGDHHELDEAIEFVSGKEFRETAEAIKKSGKAKFIGFSTHHQHRAEILKAAAKAGIADAIMVQNTAWLNKDTELNRALDAVHKAGIGLISMKQIAGPSPENFLAQVPQKAPDLIAKGLTPFGALLHAIWSDERFSTCCVSMRNTDQLRDNLEAAKKFKEPLKTAEIESLRQAFLASKPTLCADCDGRCSIAAGTKAPLGDITRYLTYAERHGARVEARAHFAALPEEMRDWQGADLEAARNACPNGLDFASLLPRVERHLA